MKKIGILGSTGSIGRQCLEIIKEHPQQFNLLFITANTNSDKLIEQAKYFKPKYVCLANKDEYSKIKSSLSDSIVLSGIEEMHDLCIDSKPDIVLNAISGYKGLSLSAKILENGIDLALSNKESIVQAGDLLIDLSKKYGSNIFPVDSEHSALWQCIIGEKKNNIKRIILTGSGGPFRTLPIEKLQYITKEDALKHPNWKMGKKITIDSATMMNKGFEVIEAFWLFNIPYDKIDIIIHKESIIHSMIEYIDGSIKAQLSEPNMRTPIQFALTYPGRLKTEIDYFDFIKNNTFHFEKVDYNKFPCIKLAYEAGRKKGTYSTVLNVANDLSVELFLKDKIKFIDIPLMIENCLSRHDSINNPNLDDIYNVIYWTEQNFKKELANYDL